MSIWKCSYTFCFTAHPINVDRMLWKNIYLLILYCILQSSLFVCVNISTNLFSSKFVLFWNNQLIVRCTVLPLQKIFNCLNTEFFGLFCWSNAIIVGKIISLSQDIYNRNMQLQVVPFEIWNSNSCKTSFGGVFLNLKLLNIISIISSTVLCVQTIFYLLV